MRTVNIHAAKTHLSRLIEEAVRSGQPFVIAKAGKPLVKVEALASAAPAQRRLGFLKQVDVRIPDDFDRWMEDEIADLFDGEP
jgi:prevent-host-death family protein